MQNKKQISQTRRTIGGIILPNRQTILRLISIIIIVAILFLGNSFPVSATTPVTQCIDPVTGESLEISNCEKPEGLVLSLPFAPGRSVDRKGYNYFINDHRNQDAYALDFYIEQGSGGEDGHDKDVRTVASGTVVWSGWYDRYGTNSLHCYGNSIAIKHDRAGFSEYISFYTHLSAINSLQDKDTDTPGIQVDQGDVIGLVGDTGIDIPVCQGGGSHLHFVLLKGNSDTRTANGTQPPTKGIPVIPEPFIGQEVYEGFGAPNYYKGTTDHPITAANIGNAPWSGNPTWDVGVPQPLTVIGNGSSVVFAVKDLPLKTKEVRLTAWYDGQSKVGWSDGNDDAKNQNWRILARCWPWKDGGGDALYPSSCQWGLDKRTLKFEWFPYSDSLEPVAPWQMSGTQVDIAFKKINSSDPNPNNEVCISFDVFDESGNALYAGVGGTQSQCSLLAPSNGIQASSSVSTDSARTIYLSPVYSQVDDNILPTGSWVSPSNGQTIASSTVTLNVNASDNPSGSGVREVRWAAKYGGSWYGIGTDYTAPYSINWDWCAAGVQNGDVELGFEVWDNANTIPWVYSQHAPAGNIHINKSFNCSTGTSGSISWSTNFYNGMDHWWDPNNTGNYMCSGSFNQGNLDQNYGSGSPCGGATDNWVGDYKATVNFLPGNYAFWVDHDDWLKLRVDGREIYSVNGVHSEWKCVDNGYLYLSGSHDIWAILAEQGGDARIKVEWSKNNGVCDLPAAFNKSSPINGLGYQALNPTLSWGAAGGASSYSYCYDTTNDNSCDNPNWYGASTATSVNLTGLSPATTYYWQVKAYSQGGAGSEADGGAWWSFTTQANPPAAFNKVSPANTSNAQLANPALAWAASTGASWYQYCYDTTNDNTCDNDMWFSAGTDTSAYITNLTESTTYYWQVRSNNAGGTTYANGNVWWSFTTYPAQTLTVNKTGAGSGTVTSSPAGINCGTTCSSVYPYNTVVTLTAAPTAGHIFAGWSGGGCSGTGTCIVTMNAAKSITATFNLPSHTLNVSKTGLGTGTVTSLPVGINCGATCSYAFVQNTIVTLTAAPIPPAVFGGWSGACTGTGTCTITMSAAKSVTATFYYPNQTLTVSKAGTGSGTVTSSPAGINCGTACSYAYTYNTVVTLTAAPKPMSIFSGWSGACSGTGSCKVTMSTAKSVTATFTFRPARGDYTGDGKTDVAVFRPSNNTWYIKGLTSVVYGTVGDIPVPADYNGDGKMDIAQFRPSTGTWYIYEQTSVVYGSVGDVPIVADFNGDFKAEIAVYRPSTATWYIKGQAPFVYGNIGDKPVVADYNGDGKADIAVFRPSNSTWYIKDQSSYVYGAKGDIPVVADYSGDGKADIAIFRPSNSTWYIRGMSASLYGGVGDKPVVGDYNGDGRTDIAVFRPSNSTWYIKGVGVSVYGWIGDIPVVK